MDLSKSFCSNNQNLPSKNLKRFDKFGSDSDALWELYFSILPEEKVSFQNLTRCNFFKFKYLKGKKDFEIWRVVSNSFQKMSGRESMKPNFDTL